MMSLYVSWACAVERIAYMQRWGGRQRPRKWFKRTGAAENRSGSKKEREREGE